ncbi:MAG TPA: HIT family protein [Acidimicrobiales bacterium]
MIEERSLWTLAVNRNQDLLGKTMLVLRRACTAVVDIEPTEWTALHEEIGRLVAALGTLFQPDQFNFAFLMNLDSQVHLHVIPRFESPRRWRDREFTDPHWGSAFGHEQRLLDPSDLESLAGDIRSRLREAVSGLPGGCRCSF